MQKGILDCRDDGIGIFHNDAEITYQEAMEIIGELKKENPAFDRALAKSPTFAITYAGMTLDELTELKAKFNKEKNKTESRRVRSEIRRRK